MVTTWDTISYIIDPENLNTANYVYEIFRNKSIGDQMKSRSFLGNVLLLAFTHSVNNDILIKSTYVL